MKPNLVECSHLHGGVIIKDAFPDRFKELKQVLESVDIPLRPAGPFTKNVRPSTPKRQQKNLRGVKRFAMMPIDQVAWNVAIDTGLRSVGWTCQPVANLDSDMVGARL